MLEEIIREFLLNAGEFYNIIEYPYLKGPFLLLIHYI